MISCCTKTALSQAVGRNTYAGVHNENKHTHYSHYDLRWGEAITIRLSTYISFNIWFPLVPPNSTRWRPYKFAVWCASAGASLHLHRTHRPIRRCKRYTSARIWLLEVPPWTSKYSPEIPTATWCMRGAGAVPVVNRLTQRPWVSEKRNVFVDNFRDLELPPNTAT